jgi:hypothetical protein
MANQTDITPAQNTEIFEANNTEAYLIANLKPLQIGTANNTGRRVWTDKDGNVHVSDRPRVYNTTTLFTLTPEIDTYDIFELTAQGHSLTIANHSISTPTSGKKMIVRIKDDGTARAITWGTEYAGIVAALPSTTVISKLLYMGFIWNAAASRWDLIALVQEA